ncbi:glucan endo-1 [Aspergillus flavus]|uniref:Glucan endo-1 n=1 Tax=Aspergillus flavus TaxID=5059 RepID=A0AB74BYE2_ASPFL|nr:hypothetical protein AFLA_012238 [Aspergillus flavus NRRL3357]KAJ1705940.1 glucan endo-1 [Aspergillus flavus]RAQ57185.1 glucan endo-1 [Aspergillus flavus]RAQ81681.1 glucan endo-1 [Aspergillus flavus]RMZ39464.1 glucan endo-1 [Aspergillus flavus]
MPFNEVGLRWKLSIAKRRVSIGLCQIDSDWLELLCLSELPFLSLTTNTMFEEIEPLNLFVPVESDSKL